MAEVAEQFVNISLCGRGGTSQGNLRLATTGITWRKAGTSVSPHTDIDGLLWTRVSRGCTLGIKRKDGQLLSFGGFRDKDLEQVQAISKSALDTSLSEEVINVSGRSWGKVDVEGPTLEFVVGDRATFRLPLQDVSQVQLGKDEVNLEFPIDDTATADRQDALVEMAFHVPRGNTQFAGDEDNPAAKVMYDRIMHHANVGEVSGTAVATFDLVNIVNPRGRFDVELYGTFLKLLGQTQEYRIQYDSIIRIFYLPKTSQQTLVVISLDPPIRKGQTYYTHILCQLAADEDVSVDLEMSAESLKAKNDKCGGKLQPRMEGAVCEVFARTLRGLSGAKLTKPGAFRTSDGEAYALRCSYKADDGHLYPLERAFFYIGKPPTLLLYDEIASMEFMRQGAGVLGASNKTFDILVRMTNDQEYVFRSVAKDEWQNLFNWVSAKQLPLENMAEVKKGPHGHAKAANIELGPDIDAGMAHMQAKGEVYSDEEDEEFDAGTGSEKDSDEDTDGEGESDAAGASPAAPKPKRPAPDAAAEPRPKKAKAAPAAEGEGAVKKPRKKRDKDAPKPALSAYMYYTQGVREKVKAENPQLSFGETGKLMGERWRALTAEERIPFDELAAKDKARYQREMAVYKSKAAEGAVKAEEGGD